MADPIRIANCSGFFGDRLSAAKEMVEDGPIDVLTGDWLAELTMLILARIRMKRPGAGYARTFISQMEEVMGSCLDRGIKVVANAGGLDPDGCAAAVAEVAKQLGLQPSIAYVRGDDLMPRMQQLLQQEQLLHFEKDQAIQTSEQFLTANAYLGCWGIVEALSQGADIVITGRVTDAAVVCGPAAWHHNWSRDNWNALAGAVAAGHVIECGTQATGGNYAFFTEVAGMERIGFPWAEIAEDGSSVIGKHEETGGEVSIGTVTSQLLYEIGGPEYFGPDVTTRFDTIQLQEIAKDRVRIYGTQGEAPPSTLKVCLNRVGGFRNDMNVCLTGLDIQAKADLVEKAFWRACPYQPEDFAQVSTHLIENAHPDPDTNEKAVAILRISAKDPDEKKVGRAFSNAVIELALASIPGFFAVGGGPGPGRPFGVYQPARIQADLIPQEVVLLGHDPQSVSSVNPQDSPPVSIELPPATDPPQGPTTRAPLGRVFGARSGDKGGNANLGVFARSDAAWVWLDHFLTSERLQELLPEVAPLKIDRYRFPAIRSLNFVIHELLEEGVAASTRQDPQAKSLGEWLRARVVNIPEVLLS